MARTKSKSLPKIISPMVKVLKSDDESTTYLALGVPYFGPEYLEGKDLQGEYFDAQTDYGMMPGTRVPVIARGLSYYDHAYHPLFGTEPIGVSKFLSEVEDEGQWWEIEVRRAYRYHDFLLQLAEKGILGASSQPIQTSVEIDYDTGHIKRWHTAEVSLTPTPANPLAVVELAKSFVESDEIAAVRKTLNQSVIIVPSLKGVFPDYDSIKSETPAEVESTEEAAPETPVEEEAAPETPVEEATTLADEIERAFGYDEDEEETPTEEETPEASEEETPTEEGTPEASEAEVPETDVLKSILSAIAKINERLDTLSTESAERDREISSQVLEVRMGVSKFAEQVVKQLKSQIKSKSGIDVEPKDEITPERLRMDAIQERLKRNSPYGLRSNDIPDNAPGRE